MATRREFITRVVRAGGFGAGFMCMNSLGLFGVEPSAAEKISLPKDTGKGCKVVIIGAGIAGLVCAYELNKAGFDCQVIEARERPGGRSWTIRSGSKVEFADGTTQTCSWDDGQYFNAGPARIPSVHQTMFSYCRELGVPLEVEVNTSRSALLEKDDVFNGKPIEMRQAVNDTRGYVSELLAKAISKNALDQELSGTDKQAMLAFLQTYGDLQSDMFYKGSERSGFSRLPGAGDITEIRHDPLDMHSLLKADFWRVMLFEEIFDMQATMLQPVGGMDRVPFAFAKQLGGIVQFGQEVQEIRKRPNGVRVVVKDKKSGVTRDVSGDYCICTIPCTVLRSIPSDFAPAYKAAIAGAEYSALYKIAWESERFWETDFNLYGGISYVNSGLINLVWYPSWGLMSKKGVVISGYNQEAGTPIDNLTMAKKIEISREAVEKLHPGYSQKLGKPVYVSWEKIPYTMGTLLEHYGGNDPNAAYTTMSTPDENIYFAGEHVSHSIWQEGAALSGQRTVKLLAERVRAKTVA
jgi:monoamine oxidase